MTSEISAVAAAILSVVLAWAGVAKLRDSSRTMISFQALGLPDAVVPAMALGVPIVEVVLAVGLWVPPARPVAATAAALLFAAFTGVVGRVVMQGRKVHCGCFGDLGRRDISGVTVARNVALLSGSIVVAGWAPGRGPLTDALTRDGVTLALSGVIVALGLGLALTLRLTFDLLRRYGDALERLEPTPPAVTRLSRGDAVPNASEVEVVELDGPPARLADVWSSGPALVVYADPACGACKLVVPEVLAWATRHPEVATAIVSPRPWRKARLDHPDAPVRWLLDRDLVAFQALLPPRTPSAFLIGADGALTEEVAVGNPAIRALLGTAAAVPLAETAVLTTDGSHTTIADLLPDGGDVVVWNPRCGYCDRLGEELADVPLAATAGRDVVFVSTRPLDGPWRLPWPVVIDTTGGLIHATGVPGTPSLVHLEASGAVGAPLVGSVDVAEHLRAVETMVGAS